VCKKRKRAKGNAREKEKISKEKKANEMTKVENVT
jgi:hypothetical protein